MFPGLVPWKRKPKVHSLKGGGVRGNRRFPGKGGVRGNRRFPGKGGVRGNRRFPGFTGEGGEDHDDVAETFSDCMVGIVGSLSKNKMSKSNNKGLQDEFCIFLWF